MIKFTSLFFVSIIITNVFFLLMFHPQYAYGLDFSVSLTPQIIKIEANPPATIRKQITLENSSNESVDLHIAFMPFTQSEQENGQVTYNVKEDFFKDDPGIFDKIQILDGFDAIKKITLAPKQKKNIDLLINIPENENESEYYFSIVFISNNITFEEKSIKNSLNEISAVSIINPGIATNVLLSIKTPQVRPSGSITNFETPMLKEAGPVDFTLKVKNTGAHFTEVYGTVIIKNMFGQAIGKIDIPKTTVLGNSSRVITALWNEKFIAGPYTAYLSLSFGEKGTSFGRSINFFALPIPYMLGIITMIILIFLALGRNKK